MSRAATIVATSAVVVLIAAIALVGIVVSGAFNVAADVPDSALMRTIIAYTRERAIDARAEGIKVPPLDKPEMTAEGAAHYDAMCTGCHLAPGMRENAMRPGMNPKPPALATLPPENPAEQFWIVKHGLKMTAMPAWGLTHSDADIWNIVALLQKLPGLSPEQYRALVAKGGGKHDRMPMER
jgi:mono/diheme cytochrome c family protein